MIPTFTLTGGAAALSVITDETEFNPAAYAGTEAIFEANVPKGDLLVVDGTLVSVDRVTVILDDDALLNGDGGGIELLANDPALNLATPLQWTVTLHRKTRRMPNGSYRTAAFTWTFDAPAPGETRSLSELAKVPGTGLVGVTRGPVGPTSYWVEVPGGYQQRDVDGTVYGPVVTGLSLAANWSTLTGKPPVVAEGVDAAAARTVIGAGTYSKPGSGIPATDLTAAAQSSLGKADSALQALPAHGHAADQISETAELKVMTATERTKLSSVATGATANATDAQLRDRGTHTGTTPVTGGGTGRASHTAYAPVLGGTSTTGAQQSMAAPPALAGPAQLIRSAGPTAPPLWAPVYGSEIAHTIRTGVTRPSHCSNFTTLSGQGSLHERQHFLIPLNVLRFRPHLRNIDFLHDANPTGALTNVRIAIGVAALDSSGAPTYNTVTAPLTLTSGGTLTGGNEIIGPWLTPAAFAIPNARVFVGIIGCSYNDSQIGIGGGKHAFTFNSADATVAAPAGMGVAAGQHFLDFWIEYEFADDDAGIIVDIAPSVSDVVTSGTGMTQTRGPLDSWASQWATSGRGVAAGLHVPGSWAAHYGPLSPKWDFYNTLASPLQPDQVIYMALQSSDIAGGDGSTAHKDLVKQSLCSAVAAGRARYPNAIHAITNVPPRIAFSGATEAARLELNQWASTCPGGADICLDIDSPLTDWANPARLRPVMNGGDDTHPGPRGHIAMKQSMGPVRRKVLTP